MKSTATAWALLFSLAFGHGESNADLVRNGSFEEPDVFRCCGAENYLSSGSTAMPGWTVVGRRIQFVDGIDLGAGYQGSDGRQWVNLAGVIGYGMGVISDAIPTEIGQTYRLTFDLAGRYAYGNASASVRINDSAPSIFSSTYHFAPGIHMDWHTHILEWTADAATARIQFLGFNNPGLSNPSTNALLVLIGLLALGWTRSRPAFRPRA